MGPAFCGCSKTPETCIRREARLTLCRLYITTDRNVLRVQQLYKLDLELDQLTTDHLANYHGFLQRCKHASTFHEYHLEDCAKEEDEDGLAVEFLLCCASNRSTVWV